MLVACKCLNIVINCVDNEFESPQKFNQSNKFKSFGDSGVLGFFKEALGPLTDIRINQEIDGLIQLMTAGMVWDLNRCLNCKTITHATNVNDKTFLINSTLMTNQEEINRMKTHDNYSPIYRILLNLNEFTDIFGRNNKNNVIAETPKIKKLSQMKQEYMQNETEAANERILKFKEQEFERIKVARERADQELQMLLKKMSDVPENITLTTINFEESDVINNKLAVDESLSLDTPPETPEKLITSDNNSPPLMNINSQQQQQKQQSQNFSIINNNHKNNFQFTNSNNNYQNRGAINSQQRQKQNVHSSTKTTFFHTKSSTGSNDSDILFEMEGMAIEEFSPMSNNTLSDDEDDLDDDSIIDPIEDCVFMAKRATYGRQSSIAKSLPILMPVAAMAQFRAHEDDIGETEEAIDIAASIQAIASSVRGDNVFGDLPRPRLNTQY